MNIFARYAHWLHTQWPDGEVEKLPLVREDGSTNVPGLFVAGDLRGIPLLKFAADSGARVIDTIARDDIFRASHGLDDDTVDVAIVGAGVAGMAAALQCRRLGLTFRVYESSEAFSTLINFPRRKPIYTYPPDMTPAGELKVSADIKEALVEEMEAQTGDIVPEVARVDRVHLRDGRLQLSMEDGRTAWARRVVCALGRSGDYRRLDVPGESLDKVYNRLHDPRDFDGRNVVVVGGGDSAVETAVAIAGGGGHVTLVHRNDAFGRCREENVAAMERLARDPSLTVRTTSRLREIREDSVVIESDGGDTETIANDVVFTMIGRDAPLDFFQRSGVRIAGEWTLARKASFALFLLFCTALYNWKAGGLLGGLVYEHNAWPVSLKQTFAATLANPNSLASVLVTSASTPSFWYTLAYSVIVVAFGIARIRRRRTPYVTAQTLTLMAIQVLPLFILPEILLPWMGKNAMLPQGLLDALFPVVNYDHGREYWRAYGFVLAWPLNVYNVFTDHPLGWWLVIAFVQTFVLIPVLVYFWGKGAYCGWICSCGALAETLGDTHRHKMIHGSASNRFNMFGQVVLAIAVVMLALRIIGWIQPDGAVHRFFPLAMDKYKWIIDIFLGGIIGYGFYFWYSGRVWCRFMCPLAALMHVYARFSRFAIAADKKKCISCNVCTSVCHQGIDVMSFANKGLSMRDPECVRCSACVQSCPTGVLAFARLDATGAVKTTDRLSAGRLP